MDEQVFNFASIYLTSHLYLVGEDLDKWFTKFETTLENMAVASEEPKFKEELGTIEQWFKLLSESEQTATMYTLLQNANPGQLRFLVAVLQQMFEASNPSLPETPAHPGWQQPSRNMRPPSLNLPTPATSGATTFNTPATSRDPINGSVQTSTAEQGAQEIIVKPTDENSWASMVSTPNDIMFKKRSDVSPNPGTPNLLNGGTFPGQPAGFNMSILSSMGFSSEAQMLAIQLMMSGLMQPQPAGAAKENTPPPSQQQRQQPRSQSPAGASSNWRASSTSRLPGSALRSAKTVPKSAGLKSGGLKSAVSVSSGSGVTPKEDDINPQLLEDVPAWLKSLRLHKYTSCFEGMNWRDMVELNEATLEKKGVTALGARRRLVKTFDAVKKKMGMASPTSLGPASASATIATSSASLPSATLPVVPHSAAP
ncbi:uncharacterized protein EV420DRAFT_173505 [Desarmillaria tabescens]|uniref:SAM domain-containing protein n=1 Tax=Armillaria tabescens TaxID=1929756 RepID=A0AA39N8K4_ARMTA|nr:uncharacterized protein EV420DRAFT_173505 [Desarmillaria tabescens]KAK0461018.1 hypothetical protein EV420DRAFT_173505 [Desarmillaria tabescens]